VHERGSRKESWRSSIKVVRRRKAIRLRAVVGFDAVIFGNQVAIAVRDRAGALAVL